MKSKRLARTDCLFTHLKTATQAQVLRQHSAYFASIGGLPHKPAKERRTICRDLTYEDAVDYLAKINERLIQSKRMQSLMMVPFVVGWWPDDALGFPVEVWMTNSDDCPGLWDIVDNSVPLYRLPWLFGMGWYWVGAKF